MYIVTRQTVNTCVFQSGLRGQNIFKRGGCVKHLFGLCIYMRVRKYEVRKYIRVRKYMKIHK